MVCSPTAKSLLIKLKYHSIMSYLKRSTLSPGIQACVETFSSDQPNPNTKYKKKGEESIDPSKRVESSVLGTEVCDRSLPSNQIDPTSYHHLASPHQPLCPTPVPGTEAYNSFSSNQMGLLIIILRHDLSNQIVPPFSLPLIIRLENPQKFTSHFLSSQNQPRTYQTSVLSRNPNQIHKAR